MTKAQAIRTVVQRDFSLTNQQIKNYVMSEFGLVVKTNEIVNTIGPYHQRIRISGHKKELVNKAKEYLVSIGDFQLSRRLQLPNHQPVDGEDPADGQRLLPHASNRAQADARAYPRWLRRPPGYRSNRSTRKGLPVHVSSARC